MHASLCVKRIWHMKRVARAAVDYIPTRLNSVLTIRACMGLRMFFARVGSRAPMSKRSIGAVIRELRVARGLAQAELADAIGVRPQTIYRIETGRTREPRPGTLRSIAEALRVPIAKLFTAVEAEKTRHG
jgi:DNA-binding XRE family transcriptional regulator